MKLSTVAIMVVVSMLVSSSKTLLARAALDEVRQQTGGVQNARSYSIRAKVALGSEESGSVRPENVRVILSVDGGARREEAFLRLDGSFEIENVEAGTHLLEVFAIGMQFPQYRVDVSARSGGGLRVSPVDNKRFVLSEPLVLRPLFADIEYYEKPADISLGWLLKNPMAIMGIVMVLFVFVLPRMIDPEQMKEMQQEMQQMQQQQLKGGNDRGRALGSSTSTSTSTS